MICFVESFNTLEIVSFLKLYPTAKLNSISISQSSDKERNSPQLKAAAIFYNHIVEKVECWEALMYADECTIIDLRFFKLLSVDAVALKCNYKNHSSITKKEQQIVKKIKTYEARSKY